MTTLQELVNNRLTDKNTTHAYLGLYQRLLSGRKESAKNVLEVGIGDLYPKNGGSIKLWRDFFENAKVYGLDILGPDRVIDEIKNDERIVLFMNVNAYDKGFFDSEFLSKGMKFDFMLDDGPHTLESMSTFIELYSQLLTDDGILIIEDIPETERFDQLSEVVPEHLKAYIRTYDLRHLKNTQNDLVFTIDLNPPQ